MTEIAVQSGQCLWGIVRKSFEDKKINASDQDIKNAVDNLVKDNKIENPNLIFAGQILKMNDSMFDSFIKTNVEKVDEIKESKKTDNQLYSKYEKWAKNKDNYEKALAGKEVEPFSILPDEYKNAKTDEEKLEIYKDSILKLAKGIIKEADSNHDGVMDKEEFLNQELKDYKDLFGDEELDIREVKKLAETSFDTLNTDKDEVLNEKDLASALGALESIDPKTGKAGTLDGKFEGLSVNEYTVEPQQKNAFKELAKNVRKFLFKEE